MRKELCQDPLHWSQSAGSLSTGGRSRATGTLRLWMTSQGTVGGVVMSEHRRGWHYLDLNRTLT